MANLKASKKSIRKIATQTARNRAVKSRLKTLSKKVQAAALSGNNEQAKAAAIEYVSALDKAAKRNVIHGNKADRNKAAVSKWIFAA